MLKAVIVDDEQNGREILQLLVEQHCSNVSVMDSVATIKSAIKSIVKHKPDLVFLDIELDNGYGFDILSNTKVREQNFKVIFTTAYEQYAIKAIKNKALDYLLKPIDSNELKEAVAKVTTQIQYNIDELAHALKSSFKQTSKLKLVNREGFGLVDVQSIIYCKSEANYTRFYFKNSKSILTSKTLKTYQPQLEQNNFLRIHKSHIINLNEVKKYLQGNGGQVIMSNDEALSVSKDFKTVLIDDLSAF